ncbi:unnamed protein product (macronuclear) [Paramecium tetraurelia]|uniref:PHD-type domain-containing protein n=1 Tax=Paramecium tetraurelia TaxID=5888 RepID=A0C516_PARTE|nr:uncharacterized protein GSPATT00006382001 [Paramecium tetraurelia]CAK65883.1 unnamed protein product [Paramecium tetraurelia]|eukprot:XP_001433280.1 hypothetical protein (macronuclear) [Paramecium tetraurelia strain d4-2]
MEITTLKDLIIKQMLDLQSTVYSVIPKLPSIKSSNYQEGVLIGRILLQANEQIQIIVQKLIDNQNTMLTRSKLKGSNIHNNLEQNPLKQIQYENPPKQIQYESNQNKEKKLSIKITPEPNIDRPCCLCYEGNENTCGKIIIIPNSLRKLQAHSQCFKNINNPKQIEFDKVYLLYRTQECSICEKQGASFACEKCNRKYHFPCFVDSNQEGILQCNCQKS